MKNRLLFSVTAILFSCLFFSCEEGSGFDDYGSGYIYMPQATVSGGLDANYNVPSGEGEYTYNFKIDKTKNELQVLLGVIRSGAISNAEFSVEVYTDRDTTQSIIAQELVDEGVVMPEGLYTLPSTVTVPANSNQASFYMTLSLDEMMRYRSSNLVMTVGIRNPSRFELSETNTKTVVIIDVQAIIRLLD